MFNKLWLSPALILIGVLVLIHVLFFECLGIIKLLHLLIDLGFHCRVQDWQDVFAILDPTLELLLCIFLLDLGLYLVVEVIFGEVFILVVFELQFVVSLKVVNDDLLDAGSELLAIC